MAQQSILKGVDMSGCCRPPLNLGVAEYGCHIIVRVFIWVSAE